MPSERAHADSPRYTSEGTRRLLLHAEKMLGCEPELANIEQVLGELRDRGDQLTEAQRQQLDELTALLSVDPDKRQTAASLAQDATFDIKLSDDKMELAMSIRPAIAGGRPVHLDDIVGWLKHGAISHGVDTRAVKHAVFDAEQGRSVDHVVIVRGRLPGEPRPDHVEVFGRRGSDADLELIDENNEQAAAGDPDHIWMCREGDLVLRYHPPKIGVNGYTALGEPICPPLPTPRTINHGPNVEPRGHDYIAKCAGVVIFENDRIDVRRMLIIDYELTGKTHPIEFDGDVQIRSIVRSGACLTATGDITIDGSVEAARIESTGGDIRLRHGVAGQHQGMIRAAGSVSARFTENATLIAGLDILIDIGSLHCRLIAGRSIRLIRGRGQVIGGSVMAAELIEVKQAGSTSGVVTELSVGLSKQIMERLGVLDEQIARLSAKREEATEIADKIKRTVGDPLNLKPEEIKAYTSLRQVQLVCEVKIRALTDQRNAVLAEGEQLTHGHIDVMMTLFPRVIVRIGGAEYDNKQLQPRCRILYDPASQSLAVGPLR
ncbi:MAG: FapA family protein [Phycisphaeraceae bacterium]